MEYANAHRDIDALEVDYDDLWAYDPDLAEDWLEHPAKIRDAAEEAVENHPAAGAISWSPNVHLTNLPDEEQREIGNFDAEHDHGTVRRIQGQLTKKTQVRPLFKTGVFECQRCGAVTEVPQGKQAFQEPHQCKSCERQGPFKLDAAASDKVNHQLVRVQMPPEKAAGGTGEHLDVQLEDEVVESAEVGDRVSVSARLSIGPPSDDSDGPLGEWRAEAEHLERQETDWEDIEVGEYEDEIKAIAESENPHEQIVGSLMPSHEGDEDIKLALALQMFSGVPKELPDGSRTRGDSHILLVGDPGTNKSGLVEYVTDIVPRGVYTSGKSASGAGLTAAAVRDEFGGGGWSIEGGAVVRAHKGVAGIDEFDKMEDDDRSSLFEALSKQQISVAKAGISATLPARTRVLAAANPSQGRFDPYAPISEQIDLDPAMVSRFDLIFIVTDEPDREDDAAIVNAMNEAAQVGAKLERDDTVSAEEREAVEPVIDEEVLKAYVAYARQNAIPVLTDEALERVEEFYVELRSQGVDEDDPVPVTARKVEAIHRLAEASARIRLSDDATVEDVERAISLVRSCLEDIGIDPETGDYDADMVETGQTTSQRKRMETVKSVIQSLEDEFKRGAPIEEVVLTCEEAQDLSQSKVEQTIEKLKREGQAYDTGEDHIRLA
ncbi:minichromosome maintenance protein MCM [Halobacterium noricense]|nr:minichromosome maintenance protein MCM [Halobacterium noricense]MCG1002890.1 minichromosome maintenance protein MCM [Halobacterium noricense]